MSIFLFFYMFIISALINKVSIASIEGTLLLTQIHYVHITIHLKNFLNAVITSSTNPIRVPSGYDKGNGV